MVAWKQLEHHHGSASDVPDLLHRCAGPDPDDAADALDALEYVLYHEGDWICPAATAALPFLLELAETGSVPIRPELVTLIALLVDEAAAVEPGSLDPAWPAAAALAVPRMLALLADQDPRVRREATYLVSRPGLPAVPAAAALWQRWESEPDRVTRWDVALAMGELLPAAGPAAVEPAPADDPAHATLTTADGPARAALHAALGADDAQLALAALHALARTEPGLATSRKAQAAAALQHEDAALWGGSAWFGGDSPQIIVSATNRLTNPPADLR
jgi:hypothetical protein